MEEQKIEEKREKNINQPFQQSGLVKTIGVILKIIGIIGLIYFPIGLIYGVLGTNEPDRSTALGLGFAFGLIIIVVPSLAIFSLGSYILKEKKEEGKEIKEGKKERKWKIEKIIMWICVFIFLFFLVPWLGHYPLMLVITWIFVISIFYLLTNLKNSNRNALLAIFLIVVGILAAGGWYYSLLKEFERQNPWDCTFNVDGKNIVLKNGHYEEAVPGSAFKIFTQYFQNEQASGDFNEDGFTDKIFFLSQNHQAGSNENSIFYYVVVALGSKDGYKGTNAILLGDRVNPQSVGIQNGEIIVNYLNRKPDEPTTRTPSVQASKYLKVNNGSLIEIQK